MSDARRDSLRIGKHRFVQHRAQQPVDDEARSVFHHDRCLSEPLCERDRSIDRRIAGLRPAHHLDQMHGRNRVEKMQADESVRAFCMRSEPADRDRRRVGRDDGIVRRYRVDALQDRNLERLVLGSGFDDEVATAQRFVVRRAAQPVENCAAVTGRERCLLQRALDAVRDGGARTRDALVVDVDHDDR